MTAISPHEAQQRADEFGKALAVIGLVMAVEEVLTEGKFDLLGDMVHGFFESLFD